MSVLRLGKWQVKWLARHVRFLTSHPGKCRARTPEVEIRALWCAAIGLASDASAREECHALLLGAGRS